MRIKINIEGADAAAAGILERAEGMRERICEGIAKGCGLVEESAKAICPVSTEATRPGGPHGELKASITAETEGMSGSVGTGKHYAAYVEFGTCKMAAQPYLVPALKNNADSVAEIIRAAVMS